MAGIKLDLKELITNIKMACDTANNSIAISIINTAKSLTPVDEGHYQRSYRSKSDIKSNDRGRIITAHVSYSFYQETKTLHHMPDLSSFYKAGKALRSSGVYEVHTSTGNVTLRKFRKDVKRDSIYGYGLKKMKELGKTVNYKAAPLGNALAWNINDHTIMNEYIKYLQGAI